MFRNYSAADVQEFFDLSLDFLVITDLHFKIIKVNPALLKFSGYEPQELIGRSGFDFVHPDDNDRLQDALTNTLSKGLDLLHFEVRYRSKEGTYKWIEWSSKPHLEKNLVYNTGRDITDKKDGATERNNLQRDLKNLLAFNQEVIASAGEGIIVYDREMRYLVWNRSMEDLTGMKMGDVLGKSAFALFPHLKNQGVDKLMLRALDGETIVSPDFMYRNPRTGRERWIVGTYVPHRNAGGDILGIIGLILDVTERKQMEVTLRQSELKMRAVFDQSFQFIGLLTIDGILIEVNRSALEFSGAESSGVLNKPFWQGPWWAHSSELQEKVRQAVEKAARGELVRFEVTHIAKDGIMHHVDFSLKPVNDETGKVIYLVPEGRDITEYRKIEDELKNKFEEIERHYKLMVGREKRIIELKNEVDDLLKSLGRPLRYNT